MKELIRVVKFTLFSLSAGLIQIGSFTLLTEVAGLRGDTSWIAYLIALVLSVVWNFTLNRKFTFQSAASIPIAMLKVAGYYAVFTPLSTLLENYLTGALPWGNANEYVATAVCMVLNFVTEFLFQRFVVFRKSIGTAEKKDEPAA